MVLSLILFLIAVTTTEFYVAYALPCSQVLLVALNLHAVCCRGTYIVLSKLTLSIRIIEIMMKSSTMLKVMDMKGTLYKVEQLPSDQNEVGLHLKQARKLQATLEVCNPKLSLTD